MKPVDRSLQKLLKAAARPPAVPPAVPVPMVESAPFALEAAVIAQLRSGAGQEDEFARLVPLFRYAMVFGLVMMLLSGAWNYFEGQSSSGATALASYAMTQMPP